MVGPRGRTRRLRRCLERCRPSYRQAVDGEAQVAVDLSWSRKDSEWSDALMLPGCWPYGKLLLTHPALLLHSNCNCLCLQQYSTHIYVGLLQCSGGIGLDYTTFRVQGNNLPLEGEHCQRCSALLCWARACQAGAWSACPRSFWWGPLHGAGRMGRMGCRADGIQH